MDDILEIIEELEDYQIEPKAGMELVEFIDEISEEDARHLTDTIKATATATYLLIAEAHRRKAHKALGYETWASYVKEEFNISVGRSYQLIDQAKVIEEIESVAPENTEVKLSEAQARSIKQRLPEITNTIKENSEKMSPEEAQNFIEDVINQARAKGKEEDKEEKKAKKKREEELREAEEEGYRRGLEAVADSILEQDEEGAKILEAEQNKQIGVSADSSFFELEIEGNGKGSLVLNTSQKLALQNFNNTIESLKGLEASRSDLVNSMKCFSDVYTILEEIFKAVDFLSSLAEDLEEATK